ncbi:MAG: hypothetical protein NC033_02530 [Clostridiales bacterium]|nr:hypothetical protein [Clostridiales bacterium]
MKASARLIKALLALAGSVVLSIGVCLAWFATNGEVDANDLNSMIKSTNISEFNITAYNLTDKTSGANGAVSYKLGSVRGESAKGDAIELPVYGGLGVDVTAILLRFDCKFIEPEGNNYDVAAAFSEKVGDEVEKYGTDGIDLICELSDVLDFYVTDATTETTVGNSVALGEKISHSKEDTELILNGGAASDTESITYSFFVIIDYNEQSIEEKYAFALNNVEGCTLNSQMKFASNMSFYVAETKTSKA